MLYHAAPVNLYKTDYIYHGLNIQTLAVDSDSFRFDGPISTTLDKAVADSFGDSFSDSKGLTFDIKSSYINPFKLIKGICVDWISQFKNESEFVLSDQYLSTGKTNNFTNDENNKVDHLLYSLKSIKHKITNPEAFYNQIGFKYEPQFTAIIRKHPALYKSTCIGHTVCVLLRLYEELMLKDEFKCEYKIRSSKFKIYDHRNTHSLFKLKINDSMEADDDCFMDCKYKMVALDGINNNAIRDKVKITFKYNEEIKIEDNIKYKIYIKNKQLFCRNNYVLLQEIEPIEFDDGFATCFYNNLQLTEHGIILNPNKNVSMDITVQKDEEEEEYEEDEEEEYEEEDEEFDVTHDIYDKINYKTTQQILSAQFVLKLSLNNPDDNANDIGDDDIYQCKKIDNFIITLPHLPKFNDRNVINTIHSYKLYVKLLNTNIWRLFKTFYFTEYIFDDPNNDVLISKQLNINRVEDGGGSIQIFSKSSIIIKESGIINANYCGFNNVQLVNDYEDDEEDKAEIEDDILKYGATQRSDDDYDSYILGGGIIELISEKNIVNNGKLITNGGTIKLFAKNDFVNNGQILSSNDGDIFIQCRGEQRYDKSSIVPQPKIQNVHTKIDGFTDIERVIAKNAHKIGIKVREKNGASRDATGPNNLLDASDRYYLSRDLKTFGIDSDWIIFEMENAHFITGISIQNHPQKNGIKKIALYLTKEMYVHKNNKKDDKYWHKLTEIDNIEMKKQEQSFAINCPLDINQIGDDKLYLLKLKVLQNHGHGRTNRFYQFQVYGKYIYDVIPHDDD